jgi:carbon monoxide dehydrogenase subunit G
VVNVSGSTTFSVRCNAVKIQGRHTFRASRALVWEALLDPEVLARTLPGCDSLTADGANRFRGALNMKIGPVQGRFDGTVELSDMVAPERFEIAIKGRGAPGFLEGKGGVRLEDDGTDTAVVYDIDAHVGGRIAGVGQRLLDSTARAITNQALEGLSRQLEHRQATAALPASAEAGPPPPPPASGPVQFTVGVARDVAVDLAGDRPWPLIAGGVAVFVALALWFLFG